MRPIAPEEPSAKKARLTDGSAAVLEFDGDAPSGLQAAPQSSQVNEPVSNELQASHSLQESADAIAPATSAQESAAVAVPHIAEVSASAYTHAPLAAANLSQSQSSQLTHSQSSSQSQTQTTNGHTSAAPPSCVQQLHRADSDVDELHEVLAIEDALSEEPTSHTDLLSSTSNGEGAGSGSAD